MNKGILVSTFIWHWDLAWKARRRIIIRVLRMAKSGVALLGIATSVFAHQEHELQLLSYSNLGFHHHRRYHHHRCQLKSSSRRLLPKIKANITTAPEDYYVPHSKFYKVEAIIRPWRLQKVSSALLKIGIRGVTVSDVRGFGAQGGSAERHAGSEFSEDSFVNKVDPVIDLIMREARTGEIGDGKIFVLPVADVIRVRTGERGEEAERMSGGLYDLSNSNIGSPP